MPPLNLHNHHFQNLNNNTHPSIIYIQFFPTNSSNNSTSQQQLSEGANHVSILAWGSLMHNLFCCCLFAPLCSVGSYSIWLCRVGCIVCILFWFIIFLRFGFEAILLLFSDLILLCCRWLFLISFALFFLY